MGRLSLKTSDNHVRAADSLIAFGSDSATRDERLAAPPARRAPASLATASSYGGVRALDDLNFSADG
jgi:hypothetical protein